MDLMKVKDGGYLSCHCFYFQVVNDVEDQFCSNRFVIVVKFRRPWLWGIELERNYSLGLRR